MEPKERTETPANPQLKPIGVLCKDFNEFKRYCIKMKLNLNLYLAIGVDPKTTQKYVFIGINIERIMGYRFSKLEYIGDWGELPYRVVEHARTRVR